MSVTSTWILFVSGPDYHFIGVTNFDVFSSSGCHANGIVSLAINVVLLCFRTMELFKDFVEWLDAVIHHWHGLLAGSSLAIAFQLGSKYRGWSIGKRTKIAVIAFGLVWSLFATWEEDHHRLQALAIPNFETIFESVMVSTTIQRPTADPTRLMLCWLNIENKGAPSAADGWKAEILFKDGRKINPTFLGTPSDPMPLPGIIPGVATSAQPDRSLIRRAQDARIETFGSAEGYLIFQVIGLPDSDVKGKTFSVRISFKDFAGKLYSVTRDSKDTS